MSKHLHEICDHMEKHGTLPADTTWSDVRKVSKSLMNAVLSAERTHAAERARAMKEQDMLRNEAHIDQVDREANAARVAERQRFLYDRVSTAPGKANAYERAPASAAYVEAALVALCPHTNAPSRGCETISRSMEAV
tara:strand:+ start:911 stop:1321 length:411 start_codon:yes stop_codon:yes gene_type:complete